MPRSVVFLDNQGTPNPAEVRARFCTGWGSIQFLSTVPFVLSWLVRRIQLAFPNDWGAFHTKHNCQQQGQK